VTEGFKLPADTNLLVTFQYLPIDLVSTGIQVTATNGYELSCVGF